MQNAAMQALRRHAPGMLPAPSAQPKPIKLLQPGGPVAAPAEQPAVAQTPAEQVRQGCC